MYSTASQPGARGLRAAAAVAAGNQGPSLVQRRTLPSVASKRRICGPGYIGIPLGALLHAKLSAAGTRRSLVTQFQSQEQQGAQASTPDSVACQNALPSATPTASKSSSSSSSCSSTATASNPLSISPRGSSANTTASTDSFSTVAGSSHDNDGNSSAKQQAQLLKQLLQLRSVSSLDSLDGDVMLTTQQQVQQVINSSIPQHQALKQQQQQQRQQLRSPNPLCLPLKHLPAESHASSLYDDASAEDYDPMLLDMMGFTSVAQYLQYKLDLAVRQAKVDMVHAVVWLSLGAGFINTMGGVSTYSHYLHQVTEQGASIENLQFVWVFLFGYYTVKTGVMGLATSWRAWQARAAEPDMLKQLETEVEKQHQRLAYWMLQERLVHYENRANRCYTEFALASLLLGVLMLMEGGIDDLQLQLETVNQPALSGLLAMMVLFWETYFSSISAVVQLAQLGVALVNKIRHKQKWERDSADT